MRVFFEEQLEKLNLEMMKLGAYCESAIASAAKSVFDGDKENIAKAKETEIIIDKKEKEIEAICTNLLLRQQPVASDLRSVYAALKMISDMERIGDQASDIAEICEIIGAFKLYGDHYMLDMARETIDMMQKAVEAYVNRDEKLADTIIKKDDIVDDLFVKVRNELIEKIKVDSQNGSVYLDYLMIAKYFERIGDHIVNISEWVIYTVTGSYIKPEIE